MFRSPITLLASPALDRCYHLLPLPLTSANSVPSVLKSTFNDPPSPQYRVCARSATPATPLLSSLYFTVLWIPRRRRSLSPLVTHHSPLSPLESYSLHTPTS